MIQCFSTIETWMRILHGYLKRLKNQNVLKEALLLSIHTVNVTELRSNKKVATSVFPIQGSCVENH